MTALKTQLESEDSEAVAVDGLQKRFKKAEDQRYRSAKYRADRKQKPGAAEYIPAYPSPDRQDAA